MSASPDAPHEGARSRTPRHDGWTGERIATFLETLADTGLVVEAYRAAGMSKQAAYDLRNRDPVVAAAWRAAQSHARPQIADGLLERSIAGTVEHYYRDGVLVGERRHYESWLGLAVLKRLDKQADDDRADGALPARMAAEWQATLDALRSGGTAAVPALFAPELDELDQPPSPPGCDSSEDCWRNDEPHAALSGGQCRPDHGAWMTTLPPPPGFDGHQSGAWDGVSYYERACTAEEAALLDANEAAAEAEERAELTASAEARRDRWFAALRDALQPKAQA